MLSRAKGQIYNVLNANTLLLFQEFKRSKGNFLKFLNHFLSDFKKFFVDTDNLFIILLFC
jgi:hypothetical protein